MRTVQADSCSNYEQIDTLFMSVGGQEGGLGVWCGGGGGHPEIQNLCGGLCGGGKFWQIFCVLFILFEAHIQQGVYHLFEHSQLKQTVIWRCG